MTAMGNGSEIPAAAAGMLLPHELLVIDRVADAVAPVRVLVKVSRATQLPFGTSTVKDGLCVRALLKAANALGRPIFLRSHQ